MKMHNAMICGYDGEPRRERVVQGSVSYVRGYVRSIRVRHDDMFEVKVQA